MRIFGAKNNLLDFSPRRLVHLASGLLRRSPFAKARRKKEKKKRGKTEVMTGLCVFVADREILFSCLESDGKIFFTFHHPKSLSSE